MFPDSSSEKIENIFEKYFQKYLEIYIKDVLFKQGRFILVDNKITGNNYYYELLLERTKKIDVIKIPFPFHVEEHSSEGIMYFDYRIDTLIKYSNIKRSAIDGIITNYNNIPSKLFDNILEFKFK
jgi:hypothetical protein